jgi:tetratricopeptide (TPR) repeat protein
VNRHATAAAGCLCALVVTNAAKAQVFSGGLRDSAAVEISAATAGRYLAAAESSGKTPSGRGIWQTRFDSAHDTVNAVLSWYVHQHDADSGLRFLIAVDPFLSGPRLVAAYDAALGVSGAQPALRAAALNRGALAAFRVKDADRTRRWARESIGISKSLGDSGKMGHAYERLVQLALRAENHAELSALADTGTRLCMRDNDDDCLAYLLNMRGESARVLKRYDSAAIYYRRAGAVYARISSVPRLDIIHNLGFTLIATGQTAEARMQFERGLREALSAKRKSYAAFMIAGLASVDAKEGNALEAARFFGAFDAQLASTGIVPDPADAVEYGRYREMARRLAGDTKFTAAVNAGRLITPEKIAATLKRVP